MEINDMQPVYECIKKIPGISPMSIRYCRAAGTDVCDRDCGVYISRGIEKHKPAPLQKTGQHLSQPKQ